MSLKLFTLSIALHSHGTKFFQALEKDLRSYIEGLTEQPVYTSVDEVCGKVRVRGNYMEDVSKFLLEQGF